MSSYLQTHFIESDSCADRQFDNAPFVNVGDNRPKSSKGTQSVIVASSNQHPSLPRVLHHKSNSVWRSNVLLVENREDIKPVSDQSELSLCQDNSGDLSLSRIPLDPQSQDLFMDTSVDSFECDKPGMSSGGLQFSFNTSSNINLELSKRVDFEITDYQTSKQVTPQTHSNITRPVSSLMKRVEKLGR
jgi:hypothetical protein